MAFNDIEKRQIKELAAQVPTETIWAYKGHEYQVLGHTMIKLDPEDLPGVVYAAYPIEQGTKQEVHTRPGVSWLAKFALVQAGAAPHAEPPIGL